MTEEQTQEQQPEPRRVHLAELWAQNYQIVAAVMLAEANTVNKSDKQQYRLKAADVATSLLALGVQLR